MTNRIARWQEALASVLTSVLVPVLPSVLALLLSVIAVDARAEANALRAIDVVREGTQPQLRFQLRQPLAVPPSSFSTASPPRIVIDLPDTVNATGQPRRMIERGEVRHIDIVQAPGRTRLVLNLRRPMSFTTETRGRELLVVLSEISSGATAAAQSASVASERSAIVDIDFRRGDGGAGRVIVDLASAQAAVDVRRQGQAIVVDVMKARLPELLRRRLDVKDFGTPVQAVTATASGDMVRLTIEPQGQWEHIAWQTERRLVVEVRPLQPEDRASGRGYRGEKLSLNFQNVEVRALLQVIADFTGLNVVASDTVGGSLTLRLKDVPWDQALDIVMQARGLDMRRQGNVLWIAPKDELLTKERLELEQRAQISELEPLMTETFQLNYQKAEAFQKVFGLDGQPGRGSILSRRGSASAEPRTNKLFVTDTPARLEEVRRLIQITDVPQRQVLIEARIVEADDSFNRNLGVRLGYLDLNNARGTGPAGINLPGSGRLAMTGNYQGVGEQTGQAGVTPGSYSPNTQFVNLPADRIGSNLAASIGFSLFSAGANRFLNLELSALQADGKGKIISSPRVVTADQQPAIIEQGEEIPYQQATSSGATSIQFKKANLKLEVTPQITPDGNILLTVDVAKDSRGIAVGTSYAIDTKHVKTNVQVENGGTVVLGGIFTQDERTNIAKVPLLGDIPGLGALFRNKSQLRLQKELLIFITPRIVTDIAGARSASQP
ncbi:MAG: type IV pilus secretin PilQ [Burkholderiaceae bacterium]|nr:type IV pilus secretin PilQ [Burkholderiaceae bacterium]